MKYAEGKYYNDGLKVTTQNECLQIINPEEFNLKIKKNGCVIKEMTCMISKEGVVMIDSAVALLNGSTFDHSPSQDELDEIYAKGEISNHVIRLGENKGGKFVECEATLDELQSIPDSFFKMNKEDYIDRPRGLSWDSHKRDIVYSKTVEGVEIQRKKDLTNMQIGL